MMLGGYMWGTLADIYGRRTVLLCSLTLNGLGGLASSLSQSFPVFLVLRFVSGIGYVIQISFYPYCIYSYLDFCKMLNNF